MYLCCYVYLVYDLKKTIIIIIIIIITSKHWTKGPKIDQNLSPHIQFHFLWILDSQIVFPSKLFYFENLCKIRDGIHPASNGKDLKNISPIISFATVHCAYYAFASYHQWVVAKQWGGNWKFRTTTYVHGQVRYLRKTYFE